MYWPHFMEQIRGRHYHHQKPPTKASHRLAGHEWPTDHPWPGTLLKASQEGPWCWQCPPGGCFTNTPQALQKYTHKKYKAGVTSTVRASSRNPACMPKACLWAHIQSSSMKPSQEVWLPHYTNFKRTLRIDSETPLVSRGAVHSLSSTPARWMLPGGMQQHQASLSQRAWKPRMQPSVPIR